MSWELQLNEVSMSKPNDKAMALFQKSASTVSFAEGFEEREIEKRSSFRAEFVAAPLTDEETQQIHKMLENGSPDGEAKDSDVEGDQQTLTEITTQIRAIEKQSVLLHGERIFKAQSILKKYRDGTFSNWLQLAYGNRQTPYRMLQFYDLFMKLGKDEKELISTMPKRAAYALASRSGEIDKKIEIIKEHHDSSPDEIIQVVQEVFPLKKDDKRKDAKSVRDADLLKVVLPKIRRLRDRKSLEKVLSLVEKLLSEAVPEEEDPNQIDMFEG